MNKVFSNKNIVRQTFFVKSFKFVLDSAKSKEMVWLWGVGKDETVDGYGTCGRLAVKI